MSDRSQVQCRNAPACKGVMGAWERGEFIPSAHLKAGRDLWIAKDGSVHLRCTFCDAEHIICREQAKLMVRMAP